MNPKLRPHYRYGCALLCAFAVTCSVGCETLTRVLVTVGPTLYEAIATELYRVLNEYEQAQQNIPSGAEELALHTALQEARAAYITALQASAADDMTPMEAERIRQWVQPHAPPTPE